MSLTVQDVLQLDVLKDVRAVAGLAGLDREIRWVHIWPEVIPWLHGGEFLLTTGYSWPEEASEQRRIIRERNQAHLAAILFQTGRFFPKIPTAILGEAEKVSLPILEAPFEMLFVDVIEEVNREIIHSQYKAIERSEHIHKTLTASALEAKELTTITEALCRLIHKSVIIEDTQFRPLAQSQCAKETGGIGRSISAQTGISTQIPEFLRNRKILEDLQNARKPFRIEGLDELGLFNRIACPIRIAGELVGYLWVMEEGEPLTDLDMRAAEHGAVVAALHILRQQSVAMAEARVRHTFVEALIRSEPDKTTGLLERARLLGFDPDASYLVGLLALLTEGGKARKWALSGPKEFHLRERLAQALYRSLMGYKFPSFLGYHLNQLVFLLPAKMKKSRLQTRITSLWEQIKATEPEIPCAMVLGGVHDRAEGVSKSYNEADQVLMATEGEGIFWFDDFHILRLIRSVADGQVLQDIYSSTLGQLRTSASGEVLYETAQALVQYGFNQRAAARAMAVHWNTLRHRIVRIEKILQKPLSDPHLRVNLQLAFEIDRIHLFST